MGGDYMDILSSPYIEEINGTRVVKLQGVRSISSERGITVKDAEIMLLENGVIPYRYTGNVRAFGVEGQIKLLKSTVGVAGCGGLGETIAELCARLGIGKLVLCDGDSFDESNLNRQLFSTEDMIGRLKVECAAQRLKAVNSGIEVEAHNIFINMDSIGPIMGKCHLIIDALDNIGDRIMLQDWCSSSKIPMVHGAIGNTLMQVTTLMPGDATLDSIYGKDGQGRIVAGNPAVTVFMCACLEVSEALKVLLENGEGLSRRLLHFNWLYNDYNVFDI
jgi:molybdopterin/thiamine biosynthesis adenylyltransferase